MTRGIWIGLGVAFAAVVLFRLILWIVHDFKYCRGIACKQFCEFIRQKHPEIEVLSEGPPTVLFRPPGSGEMRINPHALYTRINLTDSAANDALFEELLTTAAA